MHTRNNLRSNTLVNNSKSINSIVAYNNTSNTITPFNGKCNKSSDNIVSSFRDNSVNTNGNSNGSSRSNYPDYNSHTISNVGAGRTANRTSNNRKNSGASRNSSSGNNRNSSNSTTSSTNRHSSSTMSTDSSTLSSNESPTVGPYFIKPPSSFASHNYSPNNQGFCGGSFPQSNSSFSHSTHFPPPNYSTSRGEHSTIENSDEFFGYSTPATIPSVMDSNVIYTAPTTTSSTNSTNTHRTDPPPPLPPRFIPQPPLPSSSPPPKSTGEGSPSDGEISLHFF
ncbi:putative protein TPRXL [Hyalella azteca]|uniref:Uncharacterized protein n=1 Tax=Hyalella azteca TaxID=294128 RepID=A0A8B7NGK8_HYAAZ|nr:putative protein TPRXL [Hyalella azteca]